MAENTKIEWTDHTFNGWIGCAKVHAGCTNCYAEADMDKRRGRAKWGPNGTRSRTSDAYWREPLKWDKEAKAAGERRRVFCASLADVFEDWHGSIVNARGAVLYADGESHYSESSIPAKVWRPAAMDDLRRDLFALIDATPNLDWLLLTKRPENIRRMWPAGNWHPDGQTFTRMYRQNCWLLTSVSDQATADAMLQPLLACRDLVPVLGLSCEPLLGPVDLAEWFGLPLGGNFQNPLIGDPSRFWVIVGGESGAGHRPPNLDWFRQIISQCRQAGVACFVKQLGSSAVRGVDDPPFTYSHSKGGDPDEWPENLRRRQFPEVPAHA